MRAEIESYHGRYVENRRRAGNRLAGLTAIVLITVVTVSACVKVRMFTYPSEFVWLSDSQVQGVMREMSIRLETIETLAAESLLRTPNEDDTNEAIVRELIELEQLAQVLAGGDSGDSVPRTNHLLIDQHIDEFVSSIARARRYASAEPPNYYAVGLLAGSCQGCHRRRGTRT